MHIKRMDALPPAAKTADFSFQIREVVVEPLEAHPLVTRAVPEKRKAYTLDDRLFQPRGSDSALFVAHVGHELAGYIAASEGWNGCIVVEDFAVARPFRGQGLATQLMDKVVEWASVRNFSAIRLETQSNNAGACRFYQRYGFVLGGYDRFLYRELGPQAADEVALFWYLTLRTHKA